MNPTRAVLAFLLGALVGCVIAAAVVHLAGIEEGASRTATYGIAVWTCVYVGLALAIEDGR